MRVTPPAECFAARGATKQNWSFAKPLSGNAKTGRNGALLLWLCRMKLLEEAALEGVDMFTVNKTLVATVALVAAGFVAAIDIAQSRSEPSAAAVVAARFPTQAEMMIL